MASWKVLVFLALAFSAPKVNSEEEGSEGVVEISTDNWRELLTGEWMVEFYAPWCPYCNQFTPVWEEFAVWVNDFDVRVGKVDVSQESVLGGQFMVEQLPTIFHIKDGEVRLYSSERNMQNLKNFIEHNIWIKTEPLPWYRSPTSLHMYIMGWLFKLSQEAQKIEEYLRKEHNLPTWGIFGIIAVITVVVGLCFGLVCVLFGEMVSRIMSSRQPQRKRRPVAEQDRPEEKEQESDNSRPSVQKENESARKRNLSKTATED